MSTFKLPINSAKYILTRKKYEGREAKEVGGKEKYLSIIYICLYIQDKYTILNVSLFLLLCYILSIQQ